MELLSAALKDNHLIKGIEIHKSEFLIGQYADDSTLSLADDENSLNEALYVINLYCACAGLRYAILNYAKIHEIPSTASDEIIAQPIWFNPEIQINHQTFFISTESEWVYICINDGSFSYFARLSR